MVWVRLDDSFATDPKVVEAGPLGMAMQVAALCYCNEKLTDGRVPRSVARTLVDFEVEDTDGRLHTMARTCGMRGEDVDAEWVIGILLDVGLWHEPGHECETCPPLDRGYLIHDFLEYQPSRETVLAERESARERKQRSRTKSQTESRRDVGVTDGDGHTESHGGVTAPPVPVPVPKKNLSSAVADPDVSEDARSLVRRFALAVRDNGFKVPKREQKAYADWLTDMDRLLRLGAPGGDPDPQESDEVRRVVDFATTDLFWKANIGSPSKFREQYPKLRLRMLNDQPAAQDVRGDGMVL